VWLHSRLPYPISGQCWRASAASPLLTPPPLIGPAHPLLICPVRHEITRAHWHNRLGNQVLLQPSGHEVGRVASRLFMHGLTL
jgi:hypothetical protein